MNRFIPALSALLLVALMVPLIARDQKASIPTTCVCFGLCDAGGKLLPKALRPKTPLVNGTRISSDFGMRIHPILEYWAMHWGVDIAAPSGTPIYTTGDGIIEQAGLKGGYGNFVLVRHSGSYATGYAHASLFAPGIHPGAHVKQGQVIAYVGSTGLSTGPHLHYEVLVKGWPVNPECGCSIVTMPVELALRPFHGTRYFPPIIMFFSGVMMIIIPVAFSFAGAVGGLIPFVRVQASMGLVGMWGLSKLFFLGSFVHGIRKWRLMIHMEREKSSVFEGPPLFFFKWLPKPSFWRVRILYEPAFLIVLSIVLPNFFILESGAANFLMVSGIFLAMKNYTGWYMQWQFIRELMDMKFAGPIIAALAENRETEDEMASLHMASFPKDLSPDIRKVAVAHLVRVYSGDEQ